MKKIFLLVIFVMFSNAQAHSDDNLSWDTYVHLLEKNRLMPYSFDRLFWKKYGDTETIALFVYTRNANAQCKTERIYENNEQFVQNCKNALYRLINCDHGSGICKLSEKTGHYSEYSHNGMDELHHTSPQVYIKSKHPVVMGVSHIRTSVYVFLGDLINAGVNPFKRIVDEVIEREVRFDF